MQRSVLLLLCLLLTWSVEVRSVSTSNTDDVGSGKAGDAGPSDDEDWGEGSASGEPATEETYASEPEVSTPESPTIVKTTTENEKDGRMVVMNVDQEKDFEAIDNKPQDDSGSDDSAGVLLGSSVLSSTHFMAALIIGGCVGLLFAICVIMLLAYRMRKKDEGSYALDEQKKPVSSSSYKYSQGQEYYA